MREGLTPFLKKSLPREVSCIGSEADSFENKKRKISYTPEDGHIGRNM
jgi:hypothetical protein